MHKEQPFCEINPSWNIIFKVFINFRVAPLKSSGGITKWPLNGPIFPGEEGAQSQTCEHCQGVMLERTKHVLNYCPAFKDRYLWRKANVINYIDSSLDHNRFKAFCDLPDRRTSSGKIYKFLIHDVCKIPKVFIKSWRTGWLFFWIGTLKDKCCQNPRSYDKHSCVLTIWPTRLYKLPFWIMKGKK